jgi:aldose 1-epimerase
METEPKYCYTNARGEIIYLFSLRNAKGMEAKISNYGATIVSLSITDKEGTKNDIVLGFDEMKDYLSAAYLEQYPWFGCAVGRYANRIAEGRFELEGINYQLSRNRGKHQLHGGETGFDKKVWEVREQRDSFLELALVSKDGEEGYPGNLEVTLCFELNDENELKHIYTARTDSPTPCNLTHHSYFNLNNGEGDIFGHQLKILSSEVLEQDEDLVVTGKIMPVEGTAFDFREFKTIGEGLQFIPEYDKTYIVGNDPRLKLMAEARYAPKGIRLQVFSTAPCVHFYSGKWTPEVMGKNGTLYGPWSGFCLETHSHPNAVNIPSFPNTILRPGEIYRQETVYKVEIF